MFKKIFILMSNSKIFNLNIMLFCLTSSNMSCVNIFDNDPNTKKNKEGLNKENLGILKDIIVNKMKECNKKGEKFTETIDGKHIINCFTGYSDFNQKNKMSDETRNEKFKNNFPLLVNSFNEKETFKGNMILVSALAAGEGEKKKKELYEELYKNAGIYTEVLDIKTDPKKLIALIPIIKKYKDEHSDAPDDLFKSALFKLLVKLLPAETIKELMPYIEKIYKWYKDLSPEDKEAIKDIINKIKKNGEKTGLTQFFKYLADNKDELRIQTRSQFWEQLKTLDEFRKVLNTPQNRADLKQNFKDLRHNGYWGSIIDSGIATRKLFKPKEFNSGLKDKGKRCIKFCTCSGDEDEKKQKKR